MLFSGGRMAKPPVIGNVDEYLRPIRRESPHLRGVDRFVANKYGEGVAVRECSNGIGLPFAKPSDLARYIGHHTMNQGKGLVLAERDQMNFVIGKIAAA